MTPAPEYIDERQVPMKKAIIESLQQGAYITVACRAAGISARSFYRWRESDAEFNAECEAALLSRVAMVEDSLYKRAVNGHVTACIFWLCNRVPDRWQHVQKIVQEHRGGVTYTHVDMEAEIKQIANRLRTEIDNPGDN